MTRLVKYLARFDTGLVTIVMYLVTLGGLIAYPDEADRYWPLLAHSISSLLLLLTICACLAQRYRNPGRTEGHRPQIIRLQNLGSLLFHLCLVLLIPAGLLDRLLSFEGEMLLNQGLATKENHSSYLWTREGPLFLENHQNFEVELRRYFTRIKSSQVLAAASQLQFTDTGSAETRIVSPNHPGWFHDWKFTLAGWGPAIRLQAQTTTRQPVTDSLVNLDLLYDREDSLRIEDFDLTMKFSLQPAVRGYDFMITAERNDMRDVVFQLTILQGTKEIYHGPFSRRQPVSTRGLQFRIHDVSIWNRFFVCRYPLNGIVYTLMALATLGLLLSTLAPIFQQVTTPLADPSDKGGEMT